MNTKEKLGVAALVLVCSFVWLLIILGSLTSSNESVPTAKTDPPTKPEPAPPPKPASPGPAPAAPDPEAVKTTGRQFYVELLEEKLKEKGFEIKVFEDDGNAQNGNFVLVLDSDIFKDTELRVRFLEMAMQEWRPNLCKYGFTDLRLAKGGFFPVGDDHSLHCEQSR